MKTKFDSNTVLPRIVATVILASLLTKTLGFVEHVEVSAEGELNDVDFFDYNSPPLGQNIMSTSTSTAVHNAENEQEFPHIRAKREDGDDDGDKDDRKDEKDNNDDRREERDDNDDRREERNDNDDRREERNDNEDRREERNDNDDRREERNDNDDRREERNDNDDRREERNDNEDRREERNDNDDRNGNEKGDDPHDRGHRGEGNRPPSSSRRRHNNEDGGGQRDPSDLPENNNDNRRWLPPTSRRLRCQNRQGEYMPIATVCKNRIPDKLCQLFLPIDKSRPHDRPARCDYLHMGFLVIMCAKHCKICCELAEYGCGDAPTTASKQIACIYKSTMCHELTPAMYRNCAASCGLCNKGPCRDKINGCITFRGRCHNRPDIQDKCARSCGVCTPTCKNDSLFCRIKTANGRKCHGDPYSDGYQKTCKRTCGLCAHQIALDKSFSEEKTEEISSDVPVV